MLQINGSVANSQVVFYGYSSQGKSIKKDWTVYDIDLVKADLMNAFNTRVGERVMRPDYGCRIWNYVMEPLTPGNQNLVVAEAQRICQLDSRVNIVSINAFTYGSGIRVEITLSYNPFGVVDSFYVDFTSRQNAELGWD